MIFEEKHIPLKDGRTALLRTPCVEDAANLLHFIRQASGETEFLARSPEDWTITTEQEEAWVTRLRSDPNTLEITCFVDGVIAGNCELRFFTGAKTAHRAAVAISILKEYWGLGIGSAMFVEMIAAAKAHGTEILELEFIEGNDRAQRLYEKFGFRILSHRPNVYRWKDGTYHGEFYMQKAL